MNEVYAMQVFKTMNFSDALNISKIFCLIYMQISKRKQLKYDGSQSCTNNQIQRWLQNQKYVYFNPISLGYLCSN